jgi:thiamine biosynthesis lipoprotein
VVAPTCAVADAWATALLVLGPEIGLPLAVDRELEVCFQIRQPDGSFRSIASEGYAPLVASRSGH